MFQYQQTVTEQLELNAVEDAPIDAETTEPPEPPGLEDTYARIYNIDAFVEDEDARVTAKELYMTYASHPDAKVMQTTTAIL